MSDRMATLLGLVGGAGVTSVLLAVFGPRLFDWYTKRSVEK